MATIALTLAIAIALLALVPAAYVIGREAWRRIRERRATLVLREAESLLSAEQSTPFEVIARELPRFDPITVQRIVEGLLRSDTETRRVFGRRLFTHLQLAPAFTARLRSAATWSERTHSAQILGIVASPASVPALVESLSDPYEDSSVKTAAANALACIKDPEVVPFLLKELVRVNEHSTPLVAEALVQFGPIATPGLLLLLGDQQLQTPRVWAARIVGRIGDSAAIDVLSARLRDRHDMLRWAAAEALGAVGDQRAVRPLMQAALRDPVPQVRAHAAYAIGKIAGERAADVLVAALADIDYATRIRALEAFENIQLSDTTPIEKALADPNDEVRRRAALALERVGFLDRLVGEIASDDRKIAQRAYLKILDLGNAGLIDSIAACLHHPAMQVRGSIARACGELGATRVGPLLIAALDDLSWPVRAALCEAIGKLRVEGGAAAIVPLLADPEEAVREAAAHALEAFNPTELAAKHEDIRSAYHLGTVPVRLAMVALAARIDESSMGELLVHAMRDPSETVRLRAVSSIAGHPDELAVPPLIACLTDPSLEVRMAAAPALGRAHSVEAFEALLRALPGAPNAVRDRIAQALTGVGRHHIMQRVEELAGSAVLDVRLGIAWTLGKMGDAAGIPVLVRFLRDSDPRLRASAAGALGKLPGADAVEALLTAVEDRDPKTRAAVVNALGKCGGGELRASTALVKRLYDPDSFVRNRSAIALARAFGKEAASHLADPRVVPLLVDSALIVAQALIGTDSSIQLALESLTDAAQLSRALVLLEREEPAIRDTFFRNLNLEDPGPGDAKRLDPDAMVQQYEQLLRISQDVGKRQAAIEALVRMRNERTPTVLAEALLGDPAERIRVRSANVLAEFVHDEVARRALTSAIGDPSAEVAMAAVSALQGSRDSQVAIALFRRLGSGSDAINEAVERSLADVHRGDLIPFLDRAMGSERLPALLAALRVMKLIASPEAHPLLRELMRSREPSVRAAAVHAASAIPGPEARALIGTMLEDPHELVRLAVVDAVADEPAATAVKRLQDATSDPSIRVRSKLAEHAGRFGGGVGLKLAEPLLHDLSPRVRASALATLLSLNETESLRRFSLEWETATLDVQREMSKIQRAEVITQRLASVLSASNDTEARETSVVGIAALNVPGFEQYLVNALRDPKADVRKAAIRALAPVNTPEIRRQIHELVRDPDRGVQEIARDVSPDSIRVV